MKFTAEEKTNIAKAVKKVLPHGSGIDYDWQIDIRSNGEIVCKNAYHRMDENGFYDGVFPFTAIFRYKGKSSLFFNGLNAWGSRIAREEMLKSYLEDTVFEYDIVVFEIIYKAKQHGYREEK